MAEMTVGDLRKVLKGFPDDLKIGRTGYFGEFHEMDMKNFSVKWDTSEGWEKRKAMWLAIEPPYIGKEPD